MMAQCHAQGRGPAGSPLRPPPGAGLTKPGRPSAISAWHQLLSQKTRPNPAFSDVPSRWRCGIGQTPINLRTGQLRGRGGITVCELPTGGHHPLRTEGVQNSHPPTVWREAEVSEINSPAAWPPAAHAGPLSPPPPPGPAAGVGLGARGQGGGKMSEHCCRMSSTTWFWNTMVMGMLASSVSGRSSVGPKTMATFCTDMRFRSPCSITLHGSDGVGLRSQSWEEEGLGPLRPACPFPRSCPRSPAQMLKERPQRVVIGGGQRAHQVPHTAETLGRILQLWARDRSEGGGGKTGR